MPQAPHHWDNIYQRSETTSLGWYEPDPQPSLDLIKACKLPKDARIFHAGAGASTLIDALLEEGYTAQIACDISAEALEKAQERLGPKAEQLTWIVDDLTAPALLRGIPPVDLWHDRAVLHFFTDEKDQETYFARPTLRLIINQPFAITDRAGQYDVVATVRGGGLSGQAGAVKHGISQALTKYEPALRSTVKAAGFLTRDSRVVERKKYGRAKARRSFQFSKR